MATLGYTLRKNVPHPIYINQTGDEPQKQDTQANKRSPLLSEEVPYQITLIRLRKKRKFGYLE